MMSSVDNPKSGLKTLIDEQESDFRTVLKNPPVNELQAYCDQSVDKYPEMDHFKDRDHFQPDPITGIEPTDQEIDQVLAMFDNEYTRKTGRFEVPDPDDDLDNWDSGDPDNSPDGDLY